MYRKPLDGGTFMLHRCGKRPSLAHAEQRLNEKLAASAKAEEHGKEKKGALPQ